MTTVMQKGLLPPEEPDSTGALGRYLLLQKAGGLIAPLLTAALAFLIGGVVVFATTKSIPDTLQTYRAIFDGAGLDWFLPWNTCTDPCTPAIKLQQTLLVWVPLVLTGIAVAFAFRCGLFNIGGQGQYLAGAIVAVIVAAELPLHVDLAPVPLVLLCMLAAMGAAAGLAAIAGFLKATVGAHEVITTIMLNWTVIWVGTYLFGFEGPLQNDQAKEIPASNTIDDGSKLTQAGVWGHPDLQGLPWISLGVAIASLVVYSLLLNRTTLGFQVRAVGYNPEAARYGGISVARSYVLAMGIAGSFAGLAGALDVLGWKFRLDTTDFAGSIGFIGIAVALLGRNTALGIGLAALLFAALQTGTSTRNLDPEIFPPELATPLTIIIQGLIVLFVGADIVILLLLRRLRRRQVSAAA
ncbi:MAG: ABC transporter permease [Thermoleophilia bacterium]|nr:ABC transporter permease [Thermoleophilia bacterium]MDH5280514.1 ABC transporter permease [Thermoleophilia bacterium]